MWVFESHVLFFKMLDHHSFCAIHLSLENHFSDIGTHFGNICSCSSSFSLLHMILQYLHTSVNHTCYQCWCSFQFYHLVSTQSLIRGIYHFLIHRLTIGGAHFVISVLSPHIHSHTNLWYLSCWTFLIINIDAHFEVANANGTKETDHIFWSQNRPDERAEVFTFESQI